MKSLYLLIDFFTIIVPFIFSFHPRIQFYKKWKYFFPAAIIVAIFFVIWDAVFTSMGVWNFNPRYLLGIYFWGLPIEEILFFICIPYSCVFTYYCLNKFYNLSWKPGRDSTLCIFLSAILIIAAMVFYDKIYTSITFLTTALVCLYLKFIARINWFGNAVTVYAILILPFLIVNGILTGTGPDEAVVRYNDLENLGIRIVSIPVEDVFYGFEMILLNIYFFKVFEAGFNKKNTGSKIK